MWACEWDRILACIGTTGIPAAGRTKTGIGAPGKSGRAAFAFLAQGLRSETSPKKWGLFSGTARGLRPGVPEGQKRKPNPPAQTNRCGREYQPISSRASPVASALGIRSGATPRGQSITVADATGSTTAGGIGRLSARLHPAGRASLMAS